MGRSLPESCTINPIHMLIQEQCLWTFFRPILAMSILISACQSSVEPAAEADRICTCLMPIDSLNQQLVLALDKGMQDEAIEIMLDLNEQNQPVADCLEEGLPSDMTNWPSQELRLELTKQCPTWETMLQSLSGYPE